MIEWLGKNLKKVEYMGRHFEVRAAAMAKTSAANAKLYSRHSKEIYVAAKSGEPDPDMNQTLKKAIERAKANNIPADVIKRAIEKAKGGSTENYSSATYEGFGAGASNTVFGSVGSGNFLTRSTWTLIILFFGVCLFLGYLQKSAHEEKSSFSNIST